MRLSLTSKLAIEFWVKKAINGEKTQKFVASQLGVSEKTIGKWCKQYLIKDTLKTKVGYASNKFDDKFNKKIVSYYDDIKTKIISRYGANRTQGLWLPTVRYISANFPCSNEHVRKILIANNRLCHRTQKSTKRVIVKNIKMSLQATKNPVEVEKLQNELQEIVKRDVYVGKMGIAGYSIETDGCFDHWINEDKSCLYLVVDSFTGALLSVHMEKEETNIGYLNVLKSAFKTHGRPNTLKTDRRNGLNQGKVAEAIARLGIESKSSSEPTFKPNVERANENMQSILPLFIIDNNINTLGEFNSKSQEIVNFYNKYYGYSIPKDNCFIAMTNNEINDFILKDDRKVANEVSHISFNNKKYAPFRNGKRVLMDKNVIVCRDIDNVPFLKNGNEKLFLREIKDEIFPNSITKTLKMIELEKQKGISFNKMLDKKIELLKRYGVTI